MYAAPPAQDLPPAVPPRNRLEAVGRLIQDRFAGPGSLWDSAPRPADLGCPATYRRGVGLHRALRDQGYTMASSRRGRALHRLAVSAAQEGIPGALVDCGVWNGGSTVLLATGAPDRQTWAFDSFAGLPQPGELDGPVSADHVGDCLGSEDMLRDAFARYANPAKLNVRKGWFEETFPTAVDEVGDVAVLHCDGDWYDSVLLTLETFYPNLSRGGHVVIDDYGHWVGAREATDEFRRRLGIEARLQQVDYTGHYWRKP